MCRWKAVFVFRLATFWKLISEKSKDRSVIGVVQRECMLFC